MMIFALIGAGQWGKNYINTIKSLPGCKLKYICAKSSQTLNSFPGDYIKATNYQDLFKCTDIDGVIIATPGSTHFKVAGDFLQRGYNLLIEKPLSTDYKQALEIKRIYDQQAKKYKNLVVLVGHIDLYNPPVIEMKKLMSEIGKLKYITFEGLNNGSFRNDMSVLWDWGPHGVSLALEISKAEPEEISAWAINFLKPNTKLYDLVFIRLKFADGVTAIIKVGWLSPIKKRELIVVGSRSALVYDNLALHKLAYFKNIWLSQNGEKIVENGAQIIYPKISSEPPLKLEVLEFIDAIKKGVTAKCDLNQALRVIKILDLAEQSISKRVPVKF